MVNLEQKKLQIQSLQEKLLASKDVEKKKNIAEEYSGFFSLKATPENEKIAKLVKNSIISIFSKEENPEVLFMLLKAACHLIVDFMLHPENLRFFKTIISDVRSKGSEEVFKKSISRQILIREQFI